MHDPLLFFFICDNRYAKISQQLHISVVTTVTVKHLLNLLGGEEAIIVKMNPK